MASETQSRSTSLSDMWSGLQHAAAKNPATEKLLDSAKGYVGAQASRAVGAVSEKTGGITQKLTDFSEGNSNGDGGGGGLLGKGAQKLAEGSNPASALVKAGGEQVKDKVKGLFKRGKSSGNQKVINIIEDINVGVPVRTAYDQWTQWQEFSKFMKGVESVEPSEETKQNWRAKIWWSKRSWQATVTEAVPDQRIAWTSEGQKGSTKGVITFHPLGDNLTKVLLVLEYYPQGFFEKTGNIWRAVGRRSRLDLKHYRRYVMTQGEASGSWRAEVEDGEVVRSHDEVMEEEERQRDEQEQQDSGDERAEGEYDDRDEYDEPEDEYSDEGEEDEYEDEGPEDEYDEPEDEYEEPEDEYDDEDEDREEGPEDEYDEPEDEYEEPEDRDEVPEQSGRRRAGRARRGGRRREPVNA
jgi:uncharacterized membrane protein